MEEKQNITPDEAVQQGKEEAVALPPVSPGEADTAAPADGEVTADTSPPEFPEGAPSDGVAAKAQQAANTEEATESEENTDAEENTDEAPPIALHWEFGAAHTAVPSAPLKPHTAKRFVGVFAAVTAVFLAVLIVLLFVGDAGIKIYRTITHERTVFVKEQDDGTSGRLAPEQAAEVIKASTVTVVVTVPTATGTAMGIGSGFIYTADGYICTNHHVIEDALTVQVMLPDGETVDATVVGYNEPADLAVLKIDKTGLTPVKIGSSAATLVGEQVLAIGTPANINYRGTATFGRISATNRIMPIYNDSSSVTHKMILLQTDTSLNKGNSGGPLANMYGEVIGVVAMKLMYSSDTVCEGISFAIPIDGAKIIVDEIIAHGSFTGDNPVVTGRSLLGVGAIGVEGGYWYSDPGDSNRQKSATEVAGYTYIPCDGVYLTAINEANAMGILRIGDVITHINGLAMYTVYDVIDHVNRYPVYTSVSVTIQRYYGSAWVERTVTVQLLEE